MTARVALVAAIAAVCITGCLRFDRSCDSDAECGTGEFCSATSHSCIVRGDAAPPEFTVTIAPAPARPPPDGGTTYMDSEAAYATAHKRDEQVEVTVTSTATDVASVQASITIGSGPAFDVGTVTSVPVSECGGAPVAWCGKVLANLWEAPMDAFRDTFTVNVTGEDFRGGQGTASDSDTVTRWKWAYDASTTAAIKSPAVGPDGTVYFGNAVGVVAALHPDGTLKWSKSGLGAVTASPTVGSGGVYVGLKDAVGATLQVLNPGTGEPGAARCGPYVGGTINTSLAVTMTKLDSEQGPVESAVAVVDGSKILIALRPGSSESTCSVWSDIASMDNAGTPSSVVTRAGSVYFGDANGSVRGFTFGGTGWAIKPGWPVSASLFTHALALVGSDVVGGGGGPGQGGVFTIPSSGATVSWEHPTTSPAWSPAVGAGGAAIVGLNNDTLLRVELGNSSTASTHPIAGVVQSVPLIGADGTVYLGTLSEQLQARKPDLSLSWSSTGLGTLDGPASFMSDRIWGNCTPLWWTAAASTPPRRGRSTSTTRETPGMRTPR
jgi:hypothetical protein